MKLYYGTPFEVCFITPISPRAELLARLIYLTPSVDPVTTPCGHTFCRSCLRRALDHSAQCPLCRSVLHLSSDHPVTITLKNIIERNFPEEYKQRAEEVRTENQMVFVLNVQSLRLTPSAFQSEACMPLFILDSVVFPKMKFPMHIFEPRYRLMLRRCLDADKKFGLIGCRRDPRTYASSPSSSSLLRNILIDESSDLANNCVFFFFFF